MDEVCYGKEKEVGIFDNASRFAYLDIFHDLIAVGFQTAVHVMQLDACDLACCPVVKL